MTVLILSDDGEYLELESTKLLPKSVKKIEDLTGIKTPSSLKIRLTKDSIYKDILDSRKPRLTNDPETIKKMIMEFTPDGRWNKLALKIRKILGINSVLTLPLMSNGDVIGLLDISRKEPFTDKDKYLLSTVAGEVTAVIKRKWMEDELRASKEKYKGIFENTSDVIIYLDTTGTILDVNKRCEEVFGYSNEEIVGKNVLNTGFITVKDLPQAIKKFASLVRSGSHQGMMGLEVKTKDGRTIFIESNAEVVKENGKVKGIVTLIRDITGLRTGLCDQYDSCQNYQGNRNNQK